MRVKNRLRAAAIAVVAVAGAGWTAFFWSGPASAGTGRAVASTSAAGGLTPSGPGGTWGQALAVPGVSALVTGGAQPSGGFATAISCTSPGDCTAVGSYSVYDPKTAVTTSWPLVVSENGGAWGQAAGLQGIASLSSGLGGQLTRISCASAGNCSAAGSYNGPASSSFGFLANEVNGVWGAAQPVPDAASLGTQGFGITAISCPTAGNCTATGGHFGTPFILNEVNGTWGNPLAVPGLANLGASFSAWSLGSLSCPAAGDCTAIGTARDTTGHGAAYVVTETGGTWADAMLVPGQSALSPVQVLWTYSLSCPAPGDCTMTGGYRDGSSSDQLLWAAGEANGSWGPARQFTLPAAGLSATGPLPLSCAAPGDCAAEGTYLDARHLRHAFVASEVNGTWQASQDIPGLSGKASIADAISCAAPGDCAATGAYQVSGRWQEYAADEAGGVWGTASALPGVPAAAPHITGLSCTAPGYCSAAGSLVGARSLVGEATGTVTTVTAAAAKVTYGDEQAAPVTVRVTSPAGGTPTGTVTVTASLPDIAVTACTVTLAGGTGNCTIPATALAAGPYQLTATYNGDTTYAASASAEAAALTVTPAATTTRLALSAARAPYGHESVIRLSAAATPRYGGVVTGVVRIQAGKSLLCALRLTAGRASCLLPDTALGVGTSHLTARVYPGADFTPSVSASRAVTIVKSPSRTTLTLSRTVVTYGHENAERMSVRVFPRYHGTPGGRVTIKAGPVTLCVITLRAGAGSCVLPPRKLRAGTYHVFARYAGNASFTASASAGRTLRVR